MPSVSLSSLPLNSHAAVGGGWPVKEQENVACPPSNGTVMSWGCSVMLGGRGTTGE